MKRIITLTAALAVLGTGALAGGMAEPIHNMAPDIIIEQASASSSSGLIIPLILIALIVAAMSSTGGGGGNVITDASDIRLKTDITQVGISPSGLPVYQFRYIGQDTLYQGAMAQDVLMHTPSAVYPGPMGYLTVDYSQIDVSMITLD